MAVTFNEAGSCWVIAIEGRFDKRNNAPEVLARIADIPTDITEVVFDFAAVTHLMNDGIKAITLADGAMGSREGGKFSIINVSPGIMRVLRMNGLDAYAEGASLADLS